METAISFLYFKEEKVDYALIEVGMGGRMDATNVIRHPELTVISSISYDHQAFLGDTLEEIAWQKAGIIKESCPVVLSENSDEVCKVIEQEATKKKVKCIEIKPTDYEVLSETPYGSTFCGKNKGMRQSFRGDIRFQMRLQHLPHPNIYFVKIMKKIMQGKLLLKN